MRILMLGWELPPHNNGGLGVACYQLCKALSRQGVDIEFVLPYTAEHNIDFMRLTPATLTSVKDIAINGGVYDSYRYSIKENHSEGHTMADQQQLYDNAVEQIVLERQFDIIHAHDWLTFRAALRAKQASGCPIILHVHSVESDRAGGHGGNPLVCEIEEMALHLADRIITVSDLTRQTIMRDYGIPPEAINVVHNSFEREDVLTEYAPTETTYRYLSSLRAQGYHVVVNVGRLTIQKGLPNFLSAARLVVERLPKTIFMIVGSGEQYFELLELAAALGIAKNVIFAGFQRGKAWRDAYAIADLFVMPSISEPFGITPLEAIGYGTPVLISKQSGVGEILYNALKIDFWDTNEMASQIICTLQNAPLREELERNASTEIDRLSWNITADKVMKLYNTFIPTGAMT